MGSDRIALITLLQNKAFIPPLSSLENVICSVSKTFYSVEGCFKDLYTENNCHKIQKFRIVHIQRNWILSRIIMLFYLNVQMSIQLIKISKEIDFCIIFAGQWEIMPLIVSKLMKKRVIWLLPSYLPLMIKYDTNISSLVKIYAHIQKISFYYADYIVIHSKNLLEEWKLNRYKDKIYIAHEYYIDFNKFKINIEYGNRENLIGFVGRLSKEKGIINFIHSIPLILEVDPTKKFIIVGDGDLKNEVKEFIKENELNDKVKLISWIDKEEIPNCLNHLKLLVIPSYTESGPIIALESIACGTPILINKVGHVQEIINHRKNGYLMENNSPSCIAENVNEIFNCNNIDEVIANSYNTIKEEFNYDNTVENWRNILSDFNEN